ncbi:MAG TPA: beta-ketoacyl-[acyl-carrier-protein] synthase II [Deltaproteobacteria bacterium]|jgi:3-oxoacyl-[acyl-carrier-protein] synthase-1|nr:beta-ketoacyl-[acyl-carrier-protein] synthase II [Deltaproteobacteria bacterium]
MAEHVPCRLRALGMVNALGARCDEIWQGLLAGDQSRLRWRDDLVPGRSLLVGEVRSPLPEIPGELRRYRCRNNALSLAALLAIEAELASLIAEVGRGRVGVVMGTSTSGVSDAEAALRYHAAHGVLAPEFDYPQLEFGGAAGFVAAYLGSEGPAYTLSTACSSGARALASARSLLALGLCDAVVAGATDTLCGLTTNGFCALQAVSDELPNPMSLNRKGLTLGEGSAILVVTREEGGIQLEGVGESSEAHHMSAPDPAGRGAESAMRGALRDAGLAPSAIAYVNLHGTGTPLNDAMESAAVVRVFGEEVPSSSTKALVGHTLGAAGAMEAGFCWMMLARASEGQLSLPPHVWDGRRDPALARIRLVDKGERVRARGPVHLLTNSFGFGGNNCALVLGGKVPC